MNSNLLTVRVLDISDNPLKNIKETINQVIKHIPNVLDLKINLF